MTHAMVFTGVDVGTDGKARYWRVENSWGDENGRKGFYTMHDSWFEHFVFEIAVARSELKNPALMDQEPIVLPPWDPMGALARSNA
jgi:bleomycin hydrolase